MFYTGSVNSWADLRTAIFNACTANGWTLTSDVLSKGPAFVRITTSAVTSGTPAGGVILQGGTGYSAGALVNPSPGRPRLGIPNYVSMAVTFPIVYNIHLFSGPDEVYVVVRSGVDVYYWLMFSVSTVPGLTGTGLLLGANSNFAGAAGNPGVSISSSQGAGNSDTSGALLWHNTFVSGANAVSSTQHVDIDGVAWGNPGSLAGPASVGRLDAMQAVTQLIANSPNPWNGATPLTKIRGFFFRTSNKVSVTCDLKHSRYVRVDNYNPGEIMILGSDKWMIYPWYRKNTTQRDGGGSSGTEHSGTLGWAIRYDGP